MKHIIGTRGDWVMMDIAKKPKSDSTHVSILRFKENDVMKHIIGTLGDWMMRGIALPLALNYRSMAVKPKSPPFQHVLLP